MVPLALAWRYRDRHGSPARRSALRSPRSSSPGRSSSGSSSRDDSRLRWSPSCLGAVLLIVPWALIGFEGFRQYPELLRAVQDVYAKVSLSVASVAAAFGASRHSRSRSRAGGFGALGVAWWVAGRADGDRRAYAAVIGACIVASPIVWQNYTALLFLPIAITWPRLAPGLVLRLRGLAGGAPPEADAVRRGPCCKPDDMPEILWVHSHAEPNWGMRAARWRSFSQSLRGLLSYGRPANGRARCPPARGSGPPRASRFLPGQEA